MIRALLAPMLVAPMLVAPMLVTLVLLAAPAAAQPAPWPPAPQRMNLSAVSDLKQASTDVQLGNGVVADPREWPASFFAQTTAGDSQLACTATMIAARTLLLAAHCIADQGQVTLTLAGNAFGGTCERAPGGYPDQISADYALCLMDRPIVVTAYERLGLRLDRLARDRALILAGFGCTQPGGDIDGKFRTGPAFVEHPPGTMPLYPNWLATYPAVARGDAFICPGDSGGGVFIDLPGLGRQVIAVNSHYDTGDLGISYLSVLGTPFSLAFLHDWSTRHAQRLCGMHDDAQNCREP